MTAANFKNSSFPSPIAFGRAITVSWVSCINYSLMRTNPAFLSGDCKPDYLTKPEAIYQVTMHQATSFRC